MTPIESFTSIVRAAGFTTLLGSIYIAIPVIANEGAWQSPGGWILVSFAIIGLFLMRKPHWVTSFAFADKADDRSSRLPAQPHQ